MFNNKHGLTRAVLEGRKTMTQAETNAPTEYGKYVDERLNEAAKHFFSDGEDKYSVADLFYAGVRCGQSWFEKQNEKQPLYIRFGDVPQNEKSKIYCGEEEIGEENGVSVYRAYEVNGNIVIGLTLPITQTTLHTQQHLLEYDNRPCYLVKGNYVGEDADGQPLINNVNIIRKIDRYRVKEEPKFKAGDWIIFNGFTLYVKEVVNGFYRTISKGGITNSYDWNIDYAARLWSIGEANDGDMLAFETDEVEWILIYKEIVTSSAEVPHDILRYYSLLSDNYFNCGGVCAMVTEDYEEYLKPATKEQRGLLFQKMKESGYRWDSDKKELIKL